MKVVILCGGMGTRLREETERKPKPMVEIGGHPILWHILKGYSHFGFNEFILCLGYKQNIIQDYFATYQGDWKVTLADTGESTPKGTRIKMIEKYITEDNFMITYGDGVGNVDISKLISQHQKSGKLVTFTGVHPISRFATVETDETGEIIDWHEKKQLEDYINAGFFVANRKIFDYLGGQCELEEEPMKRLAQERNLGMYKHEGFWQCMDTYRDSLLLNELWSSGKASWKIWKD
jgi:glucose-1-phosphate cytidylyltransferase